jgi:probable F420-dependent oxidoreductase
VAHGAHRDGPVVQAWQNLGFTPPGRLVELAVAAQAEGFAGVTLPEHLVTPTTITTPNPYVPGGGAGYAPDTPFVDPWVAFGAMASVTTTLRFMANVFVLPLRHLFVTAKLVSSAAVLSGDRVVLGIGIGWLREEFEAAGASFGDRGARTDEMLPLLRRLLAGEAVSADGPHLRFAEVRLTPPVATPVPVLVGGTSDAALARAARADGWVGVNFTPEVLFPILERLSRARAAAGAEGPFQIVVSRPPDFDAPTARRYAEAGVTAVVNRPTSGLVGADAPVAHHREAMAEFAALLAG